MNKNKLAYLAGPYRGGTQDDIDRNIQIAREFAEALENKGYNVIVPHTLYWGTMDDEKIIKKCLTLVERCDLVVLLPGWNTSSGTRKEVARALTKQIPVKKALELL
jgi:nucleoside 2-deoxyribosyltransferase